MQLARYAVPGCAIIIVIVAAGLFVSGHETMFMNGKVSQAHTKIEGRCSSCHQPWSGTVAERCIACHEPVVQGKNHATIEQDCSACHQEHQGRAHVLVRHEVSPCQTCHQKILSDVSHSKEAVQQCTLCHGQHAPKAREVRLFTYAPPVISHEIDEKRACVECHNLATISPVMLPHQNMPNCRQCHIPQVKVEPFRKNSYTGIAEPARLPRAYKGAPPVVPHRFFMRENCLACHGPEAQPALLRTTHPTRANCRQCHVGMGRAVSLFRRNLLMRDPLAVKH
ncbi:cytochrome c3 family protein [Candidatus Entotheonella palauensis]|uniref:cytochrome c3 family protein n=1 Tax=Candidatus Entotheonella palauensis TaxID=93172 RepID=UPI000B7C6E24|nr:cytochrome c3 family protein [Candidatus Entotheonella palauensis]